MELFLIRHAIAAPRSLTLPDADRPLTRQGRERFTQAVAGMQRLGIRLRQVHHSPWLRAVETAALLTPVLQGALLPTQALARPPETDLLQEIDQTPAALVGHEPWMSELLAWLITGSPRSPVPCSPSRRAGSRGWKAHCAPAAWSLRAYLPPKVLRALGGGGG